MLVEAVEHAAYCLRGRDVSTIVVFDAEYKKLVASLEARLVEAGEAKAELVARLGVSEEAKVELMARLGVSEESKSSISSSSSSCLEGDIVDCIGVIDYIVSSCSSSIMKGGVVDYIDVVNYSDYIVYGSKQGAFETGARVVGFIFDGCVLSRRASSRLFLEEDLRSPQLFQVIVTVCH